MINKIELLPIKITNAIYPSSSSSNNSSSKSSNQISFQILNCKALPQKQQINIKE